PEARPKDRPLGDRRAGWATAFLSGVSTHSHCVSEHSSRFGAGYVCGAAVAWALRAAQTHTVHQPHEQCTAGALRRRHAVLHYADFPIEFDRQWVTVGWALEGAALCWLFRRVPHPGLRLAGVALLVVVFARLALNPAVLSYHPRAAFPIFNWYLYTYGIATVCLFAAARWLAPPRHLVFGRNVRPLLYTLGTVLAFLIVNIEIADYFSTPGVAELTFQFSGNF